MWALLLFLIPLLLFLLPAVGGLLLPERYEATVRAEFDCSPAEVWARLEDVERNPGSGAMARSVEMLPREEWRDGLPAWIEDLGSTRIQVQTTEREEPSLLVRELEDQVVPMRARWTFRLEPHGDSGTLVTASNETIIKRGTWHVPLFRTMMFLMNGARRGLVHFLTRLGSSLGTNTRIPD